MVFASVMGWQHAFLGMLPNLFKGMRPVPFGNMIQPNVN